MKRGRLSEPEAPLDGNAEVLLGPSAQRCQRGHWRSYPPLLSPKSGAGFCWDGGYFEFRGARPLDEPDSGEGYQARIGRSPHAAFDGIPVPAAPPRSSRQSRHRSPAPRGLHFRARVLLASPSQLQRRAHSKSTPNRTLP